MDRKFRQLQQVWYSKLKESGFSDIENVNFNGNTNTLYINLKTKKFTALRQQTTIQYYTMAESLIKNYRFKSQLHRKIWKMHVRGLSERKIAAQIDYKYKKSMVHYVISNIARSIKRD